MNNIFQKIGLSLIVLGIGFYLISDSGSITALIPSFLGAIICGFVFLAGKFPNQHRHFAHANLFVFGMGCGATYKSVGAVCTYLLHGEALTRPVATIEQITTFILCLAAVVLGVKSFVDARKK